jgi:hypothetical protein
MPNGLGRFVVTDLTIPPGVPSITVHADADTAFLASTTTYMMLPVNWRVSPSGADCASPSVSCPSSGSTQDQLYLTLPTPEGASPPSSPIPLTVLQLAVPVANPYGTPTTPSQAFQNTWNQFTGRSVKTWDGRQLFYYKYGFSAACEDTLALLESQNGNGQCGSFAHLFQDVLAVNGIASTLTRVTTVDGSSVMAINNWNWMNATPTYGPGDWFFQLNFVQASEPYPDMVPWVGNQYGDLTSLAGLPGQNTSMPVEKVFGNHLIIMTAQGIGGPYFDPSYGVPYSGEADFEAKAVAGYVYNCTSQGTQALCHFRRPGQTLNIQFQPLQ